MKKYFLLLIAILLISKISFTQSYNWITPNKAYLKLSVNDDGVYRITRTDFTNAGISTNAIDPRTVKVFNKGIELPIFFQGETDGVFDAADYLDFYGTRVYGGPSKHYNVNNVLAYTKDEYYNYYSDTNAYWIGWDGASGQRLSNNNFSTTTLYGSSAVLEKVHFEKDKIYTQGERANSGDFRNFNNELFQGEGWYWVSMYNNFSVSDTFSTPLLSPVAQTCSLKVFAYPYDINTTVFNEHNLQVRINGNLIANMFKNDWGRFDTTITFSSSLLVSTGVNTVTSQYFVPSYDGHLYFDFMSVQYPKVFKFRNNQFSSKLSATDTTSKRFMISGYVPSNPVSVYDFANNKVITNYTSSADTLIFTGKSNGRFEVINNAITKKPFRMAQRQVPDYVSVSNGADYLLVYNSLFETQANQLKNHRETNDGFRFTKAEIKDVYDIFNYGLQEPVAIRNFARYVYDNWQLPKLGYLCLMGRGSLDPKKNSASTLYEKNLIPVAGNPTTDTYFANFGQGAFSFTPQVAIGRLTAYTVTEAQNMVDNIITYENTPPSSWWKNFSFIVGGGDSADQATFQSIINPLITSHVLPPSVSGDGHKIYRTDFNPAVTYNYKDSIRRDIDNGTLIASFQGHAGNQDWEDGMQDPTTLSNYGKLPFVMSMTCYTGKVGEPGFRVFGERFMNMSNRGAVGFIGSTGWGWQYAGNTLQNWMLYGIAKDTLRRFGDILKFGMKKISYDSASSSVRHTLNCYGLLGDPAVKLALPVRPEFVISSADYKLSNEFPAINESSTLTIYPKNFGLFADSCKIRFNLKKDNVTIFSRDTVLKSFKQFDSAQFTFKIDSVQNYFVQVVMDYDNWQPLENKSNNVLQVNIPIKNISFMPLKPVDNAVVKTDSVFFTGLNPLSNHLKANVKVLLELDTTRTFNSPLKRTFANSSITGMTTKFKTLIPILNSSTLYYWRTNAVINDDSSGWSKPLTFSYNPAGAPENDKAYAEALPDSNNISALKFKSSQFPQPDLFNTAYLTNGLTIPAKTLTLSVRSMGSSGAEISYLNVNDKGVNIDGGKSTGLNMMKVKKLNGHIIDFINFKMTTGTSSDSVINFLNTFDSTYYLMALNASYVDYGSVQQMTVAARNKIKTFGSTKIDSLFKFGWFDTWSFIGSIGSSGVNVSEQYLLYSVSTGWRESLSSLTKTYKETYGTVSNIIGPSHLWRDFSWQQTLMPQSTIKFDVIGIAQNGSQTLLLANQTTNSFVNLSSVNAYQYPFINFLAKISMDTISGSQPSVLNSIKFNYNLPGEIIVDKNSLVLSDTIAKIGGEIKFSFNYQNAGFTSIPGLIVNVYKTSVNAGNLIKTDTLSDVLKIDSIKFYKNKFTVPYIRGDADNKLGVYIEVLPKGQINEFYSYNNYINFRLSLKNISSTSFVNLYSDGQLIKSGDYVRSKPELKIEIPNSENYSDRIDTSQISIRLNDKYIPYITGNVANSKPGSSVSKIADLNNVSMRSVYYSPVLEKGTNKLTVIYKDDADNTDTVNYDLIVSDQLLVKEFYNFPNPMKEETNFIFNLLGSDTPKNCKIRIYTSAGRLIKEITMLANIGYNQVSWDGRDTDGDEVANGTYLYKIVTEDDSKTETQIQKLVVLK
ncbi:MAG: C25 family cysteine peptidase [Ignavibacteria bacterium]